jgi:hypothetical protein
VVHPGILTLKDYDDLADGSPIYQLPMVVVFDPLNDLEDSVLVKVLYLVMAHHQADFYQFEKL